MSRCPRCERHLPLEPSGYCEYCEEIRKELFAEKYLALPRQGFDWRRYYRIRRGGSDHERTTCAHCGRAFSENEFSKHAAEVLSRPRPAQRGRESPPKGRRTKRP